MLQSATRAANYQTLQQQPVTESPLTEGQGSEWSGRRLLWEEETPPLEGEVQVVLTRKQKQLAASQKAAQEDGVSFPVERRSKILVYLSLSLSRCLSLWECFL